MKVNKAYRYELKPNNKQVGLLVKHCGVARFTWNWALAYRIELYQTKEGKERFTNAMKQHKELVCLKKTEYPWMYEVSKCVAQEPLRDLDVAYTNFIRGLKTHKNTGKPKFKKRGVHDSFRLVGRIHVGTNAIQLPRIGRVRLKESTTKFMGRILNATVSRVADRWYCSLCVEVEMPEPKLVIGDVVGVDLGLNNFAVISNGITYDHIEAPKPLTKRLKKLRRLSRQQSYKQKKSHNRKKSNLRLARLYRRIYNTRKDFLNKLTTELARTKSVICIEDLAVKNMVRNRHLARSIADVGWGEFRRQLEYKTAWYGSRLIVIGKFVPTSKMCSECGAVNSDLTLSDRQWVCKLCGAVHERDENASDNARDYGLKILATESSSGSNACGVGVSPQVIGATHGEAGSKQVCYER